MIAGTILQNQGHVQIRIRGLRGRYKTIEAVVDTGFDGWLTLPSALVAGLNLAWESEGRGVLADGSFSRFDVFEAKIEWHGRTKNVSVISSETIPLIGMALLKGSELNMKVRPGGAVTIKPLRR